MDYNNLAQSIREVDKYTNLSCGAPLKKSFMNSTNYVNNIRNYDGKI